MWIDTHAHLDSAEFDPDRSAMRQAARAVGVGHCVIPAVERANWTAVRELAHAQGDSYCLGIHPLHVPQAQESDLAALDAALTQHRDDPRLVAVGEIGLDFFVPALCEPAMRDRQEFFYVAQLRLARVHGLPVVLHVRRSADRLLKHLRALGQGGHRWSGIAHAFNGSQAQALAFVGLGLKLGFGGALTYARALQLRRLACDLPLDAVVLETDAPDIPPHWRYASAAQRAAGQAQGRNSPVELPRIAAQLAELRGLGLAELQAATYTNACAALPRLALV
jgi:TatD DNase family protein